MRAATDERRREIGDALEAFARNTIEHMLEERELLSGRIELPRFDTDFRDRPALIVVRGVDHEKDLRDAAALHPRRQAEDHRRRRRRQRAARRGLQARHDRRRHGLRQRARRCAAAPSSSSTPTPTAARPGREHLEALGLPFKLVPAPGTSQDVAMIIAAEKGAELIVSVGSQFNLVEFLDKNRRGMASTFLTRLRLGEILVDAKGVSRLYRPLPGRSPVVFVVAAGLLCLLAIVVLTPALRDLADLLWLKLEVVLGLE